MSAINASPTPPADTTAYTPSTENLAAREQFRNAGLGIFIHWGIYSLFGQGEWYLNYGPNASEYAKAAAAFYPARFDAKEWVDAIKGSGAKYITFTSRHHDGFSMWDTKESDYNIVDATPFGRDVIKELTDECHRQGLPIHFYYSHIDWTREDYPWGRTGHTTGRDSTRWDWPAYYDFMNRQLTELLTQYGPVGAIWFDGKWDKDQDPTFDWQLPEQYALIHSLQPACLIGNNHHETPWPGEDIQIFERDLPGENKAGLSGQDVAANLPLETCETMNGMWGYKLIDQNYKSPAQIIRLMVGAAGKGANLLLNIGPQPSGELPAAALDRLKAIGEWTRVYGASFYDTDRGDFPALEWGTSTRRDDTLFIHIFDQAIPQVFIPTESNVKSASDFLSGSKIPFAEATVDGKKGYLLTLPERNPDLADYVVTLKAPLRQ
ncbi:MAG: alpha-L-fucosidase [Alloprevotella sp.]|nr:alpha-L-fucosidase [Alloprevotella sp.]